MAVVVRSPGEILEASRSPYAAQELAEQGPLLAVRLDTDGDVQQTLASMGPLPMVLVGIAPGAPAAEAPALSLDVLLTDQPDLDPPDPAHRGSGGPTETGWVHEPGGVDDALEHLVRRVERHPQAAITLAQLLRLGRRLGVADALVAESLAYATLQGGPEHRSWLTDRDGPPDATAPGARPAVRLARAGDELHVEFCRPEVHNAFSAAARDELVEALQLAAADVSIERVRLCGEGRSFCSGGDLREFGSATDPASAHLVRTARSPGWWMHRLADRVTVELQGACIGAGIELAAFAGEVVANESTRIRLPELDMGLVPGAGGTVSLPRRIGRHRAAWMCLSGATLDAERARRWGLVDRVVPADPR